MVVLVTGAAGMLGQDLTAVLRAAGHEVIAAGHRDLDVRDTSAVGHAVRMNSVDVVCHLAALTDVDFCEREPNEAYHTNTLGTENVALACRESGTCLLYVSTISVFDGAKPGPYTEYDTPNPRNSYARAKYHGELIVERFVSAHFIVRAGWMFGGGPSDRKFVARFLERAKESPEVSAVNDKYGSPTYTIDLSHRIAALLETRQFGTYHAVNGGRPVSRYEFAQQILASAGMPSSMLKAVTSAHYPLAANRPRMEAAVNLHSELLGWPPIREWTDALEEYVQTRLRDTNAK